MEKTYCQLRMGGKVYLELSSYFQKKKRILLKYTHNKLLGRYELTTVSQTGWIMWNVVLRSPSPVAPSSGKNKLYIWSNFHDFIQFLMWRYFSHNTRKYSKSYTELFFNDRLSTGRWRTSWKINSSNSRVTTTHHTVSTHTELSFLQRNSFLIIFSWVIFPSLIR